MKNNKTFLGLALTAAAGVVGFVINHKNAMINTAVKILDKTEKENAELKEQLAATRESQSEE